MAHRSKKMGRWPLNTTIEYKVLSVIPDTNVTVKAIDLVPKACMVQSYTM